MGKPEGNENSRKTQAKIGKYYNMSSRCGMRARSGLIWLKIRTGGGLLLTLRRLMSYIYMEHPFLMFLDHTQRRTTVGRTTLDE